MDSQDLAALRPLVERMKVTMLTTVTEDGHLRSRPLQTLELDYDGRLWFFVSGSSPKVEEILGEDGSVGLSYADNGKMDFVSISGRGEIVRDRERMKALWTPWAKIWFPQGVEDPDLALLCVRIEQAEYWESPGSAVKRLYGFVKARATGDTGSLGEHRKIGVRTRKEEPGRLGS
jgi:general stress protein 26